MVKKAASGSTALREEPLPDAYQEAQEKAFRVMGYVGVGLSALALLLVLLSWGYVLRHRRRRLCALRMVLGLTLALWVLGLVGSHTAIWELMEEFFGIDDLLGDWDRDHVCGLHTVITLGFAEPASLLLIAALIRTKTLRDHRTCTKRWLLRRSLGLALLVMILQGVFVALPQFDLWENIILEPRPPCYCVLLAAADGGHECCTTQEAGSGATFVDRSTWWRDEGCAQTIASVGVSTVFVVPFEAYWALACYRLLGLILNLKLKSRLYWVQLTFTLVPAVLLLLRFALLLYDSHWSVGRRLMRDAELVLVLFGCVVAVRSLILRPVHEGGLADYDGEDDGLNDEDGARRSGSKSRRRSGGGSLRLAPSRRRVGTAPSPRRPSSKFLDVARPPPAKEPKQTSAIALREVETSCGHSHAQHSPGPQL